MQSCTKQTRKESSRTVTWPSGDFQRKFFRRFKQLGKFSKKVAQRSRDSGWRSCDRRPTVKQRFWRFKQLGKFLKKVTERSRDSGWRSRDRRPTVEQRILTFQAIRKNFDESHGTVTRQWSEVTRLSADCQTTFFQRFKQLEECLKKSLNGHATVIGGHATVERLSCTISVVVT